MWTLRAGDTSNWRCRCWLAQLRSATGFFKDWRTKSLDFSSRCRKVWRGLRKLVTLRSQSCFFPWCQSLFRKSFMQMLFFGSRTIAFAINDIIASPFLLFISLRCHSIQLTSFSDVVAFQILSMKVVIDNISILEATCTLLFQGVIETKHVLIIGLMWNNAICGRFSTFVWWRKFSISSHIDFHLTCIINALMALLCQRIIEFSHQWIKSIGFHMLFCCLQEIHTLLLSKLPWEKDGWYWTKVKMGCVFLKHLDDSELSINFTVESQNEKETNKNTHEKLWNTSFKEKQRLKKSKFLRVIV